MRFHTALLLATLLAPFVQADTIIDSTTSNGGFVSASHSFNGSLNGWIATQGVWITSGNSSLTSSPFGADTASDTRYIQIHNDEGETLTSTTEFEVTNGEVITLSFDYKIGGSGADTTLSLSPSPPPQPFSALVDLL